MPLYRYKAVNAAGAVTLGEIEASDEAQTVDRLRDQGLLPMRVEPALPGASAIAPRAAGPTRAWFASNKVNADQLLGLTRELSTLLRAGLPLDRAHETLIGLAPTVPVQALLQRIRDDVRGGKSLSQAIDVHRTIFSRFYVNIVRAGEAGGALGVVLQRLAETMERNKELRDSIKSALVYPTILIFVAVASVMVLLVFVVPQFEQTFEQAGKALPLPTEIVIAFGNTLRHYGWGIMAGFILFVFWWRRHIKRPSVRAVWDRRLLGMPLLGDLLGKVEVARFSRTLGTLLGNGVTLLAGLSIVKDTMTNYVLSSALDGVITQLREGRGFGRPLAQTGVYPRLASQLILVGEESGRLEEMLLRVADIYDREVQMAIKRFLAILEPVLILSLAVVIGGIIFSILLGVMGLSELVG